MLEILWEAAGDICRYAWQMLPCACAALLVWLLLSPWRRRRLARMGLVSPPLREGALLLFVLFCAGLGALTLFPSGLWSYLLRPESAPHLTSWRDLYPTGAQLAERLSGLPEDLPRLLTPFPGGIGRHFRSYWSAFLFLGNIGMFLPIGFFPALLGRRPRGWKALLTGAGSSLTIETVQLFIHRGTDLDDLILNTAGAVTGFWLYRLLAWLAPRLTDRFKLHERRNTFHGGTPGTGGPASGADPGQL